MNTENYKNLLKDVVLEILEKKNSYDLTETDEFAKGYNFAIYEVVSLLVEQSESFNIDKNEIGLGDINPEKDFLNI